MNTKKEKKGDRLTWIIVSTIILFSAIILLQRGGWMGPKTTVSQGPLIVITEDNFREQVAEGVMLLDVWAEWCKPCKALEPTIKEIAQEMEGQAKVGKLDADGHRRLASELGIEVLPTIILFKDGKEVERFMGIKSKETLTEAIRRAL